MADLTLNASTTGNGAPKQDSIHPGIMESDDPMVVCQHYLAHRGVQGTVIFAMMTGSQAYNLATPASDKDYLGIYMVDSKELLSIDGEFKFPNQPLSSLPDEEGMPDATLYEVKQFVKLLIKGNPFMIETLFTERHYASTEAFDRLRALRHEVLTKTLVEEFLSYIRGQMVVHQKKGLKGKRVYHIIRLLYELNRIVGGESPWIAFPDGPERDHLMGLRKVEQPGLAVIEAAEGMIRQLEKLRPWNLPDDCEQTFDKWLIDERIRKFKEAVAT